MQNEFELERGVKLMLGGGRRNKSWRQCLARIPVHLWLGGFALVGVFSALPAYIYAKHLDQADCPAL